MESGEKSVMRVAAGRSPLILLLTCSLDETIWSMSVRSTLSSGARWASQASASAPYWLVVWDNTCLYSASEIWAEGGVQGRLVFLGLFCVCFFKAVRWELTNIQCFCLCCSFPLRRGAITLLSSGWRLSITRLARICAHTQYISVFTHIPLILCFKNYYHFFVQKYTKYYFFLFFILI